MKILSPAIKAASAFTLGGAAFAIANLLLARYLTTESYGEFSLILAISILSIPLGPLGLDAIVLRHRPGPQPRLLRISVLTGLGAGALIALLAKIIYPIDAAYVPLIAIAIAAGSATRVGSAVFQSEKRYAPSLWMIQSQNIMLILAAVAVASFGVTTLVVYSAYTLHWALAALVGWLSLTIFSKIVTRDSWRIPWDESPPLFGYVVAAQLSGQLDRLMIPKLLDIESLATFGVLSALVLAPFKMFQAGMGYTLIPGLRAAVSKISRKGIIIHEARTAAFVIFLAIASGFTIAPWVADMFLQGKYELGRTLIAAAVIVGSIQVVVMFVSSIVTALGNRQRLEWLNRSSWLALLVSVIGGWYGSRWGLPGVILGFALGSLARLLTAALIAARVWKEPDSMAAKSTSPA
jgi:O-antigen/teichoic acid export membrane protein